MKQKRIIELLAFVAFMGLLAGLFGSCSKAEAQEIIKEPQAVTYVFKITGDTIIHWHKVYEPDLSRFRAMPKESEIVPGCDSRIQVLIIGEDKCKK